ncbi:glycosyltransferase family 39 protein, partial [Candidatus Woesearchaeota archaeon]|nr:glycosyltransferase family 39 protein [Candidatus Woesearchaeota archaeon]
MAYNEDTDKEVNKKIILIDRKLKDAFSNVKKDIKSIKGSLEKQENIDKKELNTYISDFEKNINTKIKKIEEEFSRKKFDKEDIDSKLSSFKSFLLNNLKDIKNEIKKTRQLDKEPKVLPYLKRQIGYFRSKLEKSRQRALLYKLELKQEKKIQELMEKFSADKGKKEESIFENSLINQLEWYKDRYGYIEKQQKDIENLKKSLENEHNKDKIKLEKEKKEIINFYEKKIDSIEISNKQYQQFIINKIEESQKNFNEILSKNEEKFEKIIKDLDKKRQEDNIFLLNNINSLNKKKDEKLIKKKSKIDYIGKGKIIFFNIVPYIFLALLVLITVNQFFKFEFITKNIIRFIILAIAFGAVTFWHNRNKINFELDKEKKDEELKEEIKKREFPIKFPNLNKIPVLRNIAKWMYKEGWFYSILIILIISVSFFVRAYNLNNLSFGDDEFPSIYASKSFLGRGIMSLPSGTLYLRSLTHNLLTSLSMLFFGFNPFGARFPSIIASLGSIFLIYFIIKYLSNKKIAILATLTFSLLPWEISWAREARMYALFQLFYLLLIFILLKYKSIKGKGIIYQKILIILITILIIFTHQIGLLVLLPLLLLIVTKNKNIKYSIIIIITSLILIIIAKLALINIPFLNKIITNSTFFTTINFGFFNMYYINFLIENYPLIVILSLFGLISFISNYEKLRNNKLYIIYLFLFIPFISLSILLNWESQKYIYFLFPLFFILFIRNLTIISNKKR